MSWHTVVSGYNGYSKINKKQLLLARRGWIRTLMFWICIISIYLIPVALIMWVVNGFKLRFYSVKERLILADVVIGYRINRSTLEDDNTGTKAFWTGVAAHNFREKRNISMLLASYMAGSTPSVSRKQVLKAELHLADRRSLIIVLDDNDRKRILEQVQLNLSDKGIELFYAMLDDSRIYSEIERDIEDIKSQIIFLDQQIHSAQSYDLRKQAKLELQELKLDLELKVNMLRFFDKFSSVNN